MSGIALVSGEHYQHGTRARYVHWHCRCAPCRKSNTEYAKVRALALIAGDNNGLVSAAAAQAHLNALSAQGIGKRAVAAASDVSLTVLQDVRNGTKTHIRARTERRILAVDAGAMSDHAHVPAKETRAAMRELLRHGLTKREIAARLGSTAEVPALQLTRRHVTALNAMKVRKLLTEVRAEVEAEKRIGTICTACGDSHEEARRAEVLRTMLDAETTEIREAFPCWYPPGSAGSARLTRDRKLARGVQ